MMTTERSGTKNGPATAGRVVCLIEQDPRNRNALVSVLDAAGIEITNFASAHECRQRPRTGVACPPDEGDHGPAQAATILRDLDASESARKEKSSPRRGHLRADALLEKLPWQVRLTTLCTLFGPPTASLILLTVDYLKYWRAVPFNFGDFLAAYFLFAIPVGYVFGAVPALLAALLYCVLLTANSGLVQRRPLTRACVAALCGGLTSGVWFWFWQQQRIDWAIYLLVGALVMAALSRILPSPGEPARQRFALIGQESCSTRVNDL